MEKFLRCVAMHKKAFRIVAALFWVVAGCVVRCVLDVPPEWCLSLMGIGICFSFVWISASTDALLRKPLKHQNEHCDPYPMLEEMTIQMNYPDSGVAKQLTTINYATALRNIGEYEKAHVLLSNVNIDKYPGMLPAAKLIYYNNLMDILALLGNEWEADIWYNKMMQIYRDMKENKQKKQFEQMVNSACAQHFFCKQQYDLALRMLDNAKSEYLSQEVDNAMLYARVCLAMGNTEKAKEKLQFVIQNGNRLYCVTEANEMLAQHI